MTHHELQKAAQRLLAAESGTLVRSAPLRVALCYPSPYTVGMSSLGFQTIYGLMHAHPQVTAERVFLPDDVGALKEARLAPVSIETQTALSAFPVLAFSVAYELEITGLFELLTLAGLKPKRDERPDAAPLVVAGGPLTFSNPAPLEPFVDVLLLGEGEDLVHELLTLLLEGLSKQALREALARRPGFFVPGLSPEAARYQVARASDERLPAYSRIITPHTELSGMFLIEPERGCSRGCHYCVMRRTTNGGMRTVPMERVLELVPPDAAKVGLVGAAVTDHPRIVELLEALVSAGRQVGVSSLRADRLSQRLVNALKAGGAQVLTVASDGASQRLRNLVDRKHSETQLLDAARFAKTAGMKRLKVYNLVGLPTEEADDIEELIRFTLELARIIPVALGVAPFAAKRHTPLDGSPFAGITVVEERLERLRKGLRGKVEVRPTSARWAWVEYMLAQAGAEAGLAALTAWENGGAFVQWKKAFEAHGVRPYLAARTPDGRQKGTVWPTVASTGPAPVGSAPTP